MAEASQHLSFAQLGRRLQRNAGEVLTAEVMAAIAGIVETGTLDRMEREVDVAGKPLAPLSEKYLRWKRFGTTSASRAARRESQRSKKLAAGKRAPVWKSKGTGRRVGGYSPKIWQLTGESKRKVRTIDVTKRSATVQINTPYSGFVQDGTADMPPRPVLGMSKADEESVLLVIGTAMQGAVTEG